MWSTKKFVIVLVSAAALTALCIGGVAFAQGNGDENTQPEAQQAAMLEKVCEIYQENTGTAINADDLQAAFTQAQSEMQEEALDNYLNNLVEQGTITQEQADQYKAWLESKPEIDIPLAPGFPGADMQHGPGGLGGGFPGGGGPPPSEPVE
jgi:hypothetical protein